MVEPKAKPVTGRPGRSLAIAALELGRVLAIHAQRPDLMPLTDEQLAQLTATMKLCRQLTNPAAE